MMGKSMGANPFVFRVKTKKELMRLKQLEGLVKELGKEVTTRYLGYVLRDTSKVVRYQVPKNEDNIPSPPKTNTNKDRPLQDMNKPKVGIQEKFSYAKYLPANESKKITFEEFITAAHRWGANVVGATAEDLKGYLLHLGSVSAMAATQRYDPQMHVDYDKAIRKQAEEVGWAAFKANNAAFAKLYYITEDKEQHDDPLDPLKLDTDQGSVEETVMADEPQNSDTTICSASDTVGLHQREDIDTSCENTQTKSDLKWQSLPSISAESSIGQDRREDQLMSQGLKENKSKPPSLDMACSDQGSLKAMLPPPAELEDETTDNMDTKFEERSAHSSGLSNQPDSKIPQRHICQYCSKSFGSATTLKVHLMRHTVKRAKRKTHTVIAPSTKNVHLCSLCGKQFKLHSELKQHMRHHTGERPYPCSVCGEKLISASSLNEHMKRHTEGKKHVCSYCGKQFYTSSGLRIHTRIHTGEKPYACPYCDKRFRGSGYMKSHMLVHTQERPHKCPKCDRGFNVLCNLKRHMLTHTGERPYKCPYCSMACRQPSALKAHIDVRHRGKGSTKRNLKHLDNRERTHICSKCEKGYIYLASLKVHMISHTGGDPLTCPECSKKFTASILLRYHMMNHTGEKPYECKECGKVFRSAGNLEVHAVVHTGEKPYKCLDCGRAFNSPCNLQRHKLVHTGEKTFVCSYCGKAFGQKNALQLHIMIHTGEKPFVCAECGKGFSRAADLRKHMKVHRKKN